MDRKLNASSKNLAEPHSDKSGIVNAALNITDEDVLSEPNGVPKDFILRLNEDLCGCHCGMDSHRHNSTNSGSRNGEALKCYRTNSIPFSLANGKSSNSWTLEQPKSSAQGWLSQRVQRTFTKKMLQRRIPILGWMPTYSAKSALCDLVAGLTVGLTVIPQAIAYANVAGLPPQYGLYSAFMASFFYSILGSCKDTAIGPTAIVAILTKENIHGLGPEFAVLLCFLGGCVVTLMGVLQLGFLIDFISGPVLAGFTTAAAIIIATTQIKDVLGLKIQGDDFVHLWDSIFHHIWESRLYDAILGLACIAILLSLRKIKDISKGPNFMLQVLWFFSTARNIIVVVFSAILAYAFELNGYKPFVLSGTVKSGLPNFALPPFEAVVNNQTYSFADMATTLGSGILVVPLLAILENITIAKVFSGGKAVDGTQELIALGISNIAASFVSSMPVTGALSRGAVNHASGAQTPFGGVYSGIIVLLSLQFFTPYLSFIPKAALAAVIIAAVIFMVEFHVIKPMWRTKKTDLIPAVVTFLSCLFIRLEIGMVIGVGVNVLFLLYASARPSVNVQNEKSDSGCEYLRITPDRSLVYPSVEYVRNVVSKAGIKRGSSSIPVVIDSKHIQAADFTAAKGIKCLIDDFVVRGQPILFVNLKPSLVEMFQSVQPKEFRYSCSEAQLNDMLKSLSAEARIANHSS